MSCNLSKSILSQKGHRLSFPCVSCHQKVPLVIFELEQIAGELHCPHCNQDYCFNDPVLLRQLGKFEALCRQIAASEEILSNSSVGVDVGQQSVKIPFRLLLTRMNACLDLIVGKHRIAIAFRLEPMELGEGA